MKKYIAVDLGASNGRVIAGNLEHFEVIRRFPSWNVALEDGTYWDILAIFTEIKKGIGEALARFPGEIVSIGIDSWGVDHALLDKGGRLIGNPYTYRDSRTDRAMEELFRIIPKEEIYMRTGVQCVQFNTIYQLWAMKRDAPDLLRVAEHYLSIPDLLAYWLTGTMKNEFTHASTTQLIDLRMGKWDFELIERLGLPSKIFGEIVPSGVSLGGLTPALAEEFGISEHVEVFTVGCHDTASAVAAVPVMEGRQNLFLSLGTWSLLGVESAVPLINEKGLSYDLSNEGAVEGVTVLKNIAGMWILQESKGWWDREGKRYNWKEFSDMARKCGAVDWEIDPTDPLFFAPSSPSNPMPARIVCYCRDKGWKEPQGIEEIVRGIFQGLARTHAATIDALEDVTGQSYRELFVVGGGCQEELVCELTAEYSGRTVHAGPVEATALGNIMVQAIASGDLKNIAAGRRAIRENQMIKTYNPHPSGADA